MGVDQPFLVDVRRGDGPLFGDRQADRVKLLPHQRLDRRGDLATARVWHFEILLTAYKFQI